LLNSVAAATASIKSFLLIFDVLVLGEKQARGQGAQAPPAGF
jgi:hypothetical protein